VKVEEKAIAKQDYFLVVGLDNVACVVPFAN
jgi:hypothetical protein